MGLDSYLYRIISTKNWKHRETKHSVTVKQDGKLRKDIKVENITQVKEEIGYFRKFNALHSYIVKNYAAGVDDCKPIHLSKEDFKDILDVLEKALITRCSDNIPPSSGFFFGSIDVDEYYWEDVAEAVKMISDNLKISEGLDVDFEYQASW